MSSPKKSILGKLAEALKQVGETEDKMGQEVKHKTIKLPNSIVEALEAKALEEGTTTTDIVIRALKPVLGGWSEKFCKECAPAEEIERKVAKHTEQLSKLNQELAALRHRLKEIEDKSNL